MEHDAIAAKKLFDELDQIVRTTGANKQSHIFAERARNALANAYNFYGKCELRKEANAAVVEKADKLVKLGVQEVVYGAGRSLLRY